MKLNAVECLSLLCRGTSTIYGIRRTLKYEVNTRTHVLGTCVSYLLRSTSYNTSYINQVLRHRMYGCQCATPLYCCCIISTRTRAGLLSFVRVVRMDANAQPHSIITTSIRLTEGVQVHGSSQHSFKCSVYRWAPPNLSYGARSQIDVARCLPDSKWRAEWCLFKAINSYTAQQQCSSSKLSSLLAY